MRRLARFAYDAEADAITEFPRLKSTVDAWLEGKGAIRESDDAGDAEIELRGDRIGRLRRTAISTNAGELYRMRLEEPTAGGRFSTTLAIAGGGSRLALSCDLEGGQEPGVVAPTWFDVRVPRLLGDLLNLDVAWNSGGSTPSPRETQAVGATDGETLVGVLLDPHRRKPLIVVSEWDGLVLHPGLAGEIARDLGGLADVWMADTRACWVMTSELGKERSCYQGAIRLYWPRFDRDADPIRHPLWTSTRLLHGGGRTTRQAAQAIRATPAGGRHGRNSTRCRSRRRSGTSRGSVRYGRSVSAFATRAAKAFRAPIRRLRASTNAVRTTSTRFRCPTAQVWCSLYAGG